MALRSLAVLAFALVLCVPSIIVTTVNAAPLSKQLAFESAGPNSQCLVTLAPEEKDEFHRNLNEAREIWARDEAVPSSPSGDEDDGSPPKAPGTGSNVTAAAGQELWKDKFVFNVSFNVVYTNNTEAGGYEPADRVNAQIERLNQDFNNTGISFVLVNTTWINNPDWFVNAAPGSPAEKEMKERHNVEGSTTLNVYTVTFNRTTRSLGTATMPSFYFRQPKLDGVLIRHSTLPGASRANFNMGRTLTHEVGHWLGLYHIFEGGCSDPVGDNIADTPPQSSGTEGCPKGKISCKGKGPDLINNFMDYTYDSCMDSFTKLQIVRMLESARAFRRPGARSVLTPNSTVTQSHWQW